VACDRMRIAQAVMNLVSNAHQHGDRKTPIQISLARGVDAVTIAVANRGQMIDPDRLTTIFEPYQRSGKGLGLGLYIISEIARAHGGRVDATSTAEHTTFQLTLPV
ncbi:MAG TPA: sensor histidine kinase, partial [Kofleriaceae bacterium]